jgi:urease beta subunit
MIPGEYILAGEDTVANAWRPANSGGSHPHILEANKALRFGRALAFGRVAI